MHPVPHPRCSISLQVTTHSRTTHSSNGEDLIASLFSHNSQHTNSPLPPLLAACYLLLRCCLLCRCCLLPATALLPATCYCAAACYLLLRCCLLPATALLPATCYCAAACCAAAVSCGPLLLRLGESSGIRIGPGLEDMRRYTRKITCWYKDCI